MTENIHTKHSATQHRFRWVIGMLLGLIAFSLFSPFIFSSSWDLIQKRGVLLYGTRTSLLSYFKSGDNIIGYEYQLLKKFTESQGLELKPKVYSNNGDLFRDLQNGQIDIAGGHLTVTKARSEKFNFTAAISQTNIDLVTHFKHRNKTDIQEFSNQKGVIIENSSYEELLDELPEFKPTHLNTSADISLFEIIRKINAKEIDYTFGDSEIINIYQYFIPGIYQTIQLSEATDTAFMLRKNRSEELSQKLDEFIINAQQTDLLVQLKQQIVFHLPDIDTANTVTFFDKLQTAWPQIKDLVFQVSEEYDFDAALLAAISYQESHWEVDAESFTGVKGLMMLTSSAAEDMGVEDRTDPRQSLEGGVKYFRYMLKKIPKRIKQPHRTLMALAAYNVGYGHLEDARILTQRAGKNPDDWFEIEPFLAQLNNPSIEHQLKYGNADGYTAVIYVNNIMTYRQLMNWKINKEMKPSNNPESIL